MIVNSDSTDTGKIAIAGNPTSSSRLVGHTEAWETFLKSKKDNKIHHAWLLTGPKGIGKATFCWKVAENLLNEAIISENNKFSDITHTSPQHKVFLCERQFDNKTNRLKKVITVDEVRRLKSFFSMSSTDKKWRIAIVDSADDLSKSASNALLKILEEPPSKSIFLVVANQVGRIQATIRSRCRTLTFDKLQSGEIEQVLKDLNYDMTSLSDADKHILAIISEGSVGMTINTINSGGISMFKQCLEILEDYPYFNRSKIHDLAETISNDDEKFRFFSSVLLLVISRITLLSARMKYLKAVDQEILVIKKLPQTDNLIHRLAELHSKLSQLFLSCLELNLYSSNKIVSAFIDIEESIKKFNG